MPRKAERAFSDLGISEFKSGKFLVFLQLLSAVDFNRHALMYERYCDVKRRLLDLYEYRRRGILTEEGSNMYLLLNDQRKDSTDHKLNWKHLLDSIDYSGDPPKSKKMKPIQIEGSEISLFVWDFIFTIDRLFQVYLATRTSLIRRRYCVVRQDLNLWIISSSRRSSWESIPNRTTLPWPRRES